jgi:phosphoribosylanthranilate isomerase
MKIKICGVKTIEAARIAAQAGADLLGLVFYPPSPRYLAPEVGDRLVEELSKLARRPKLVGLFVNVPQAEMAEAVERYGLDYLQLSGDETPEQCAEIARLRPVIRALRLPAQIVPDQALELAAPFTSVDNLALLLDTHKSGMYGGTGQIGNWEAARALAQSYSVLLAGGLNPGNVAEAVAQVRPWGVDVSSGVEKKDAPGEKDLNKIVEFIKAARSAENGDTDNR